MNDLRGEFTDALRSNEKDFGVDLSETDLNNLTAYYELVEKHNPILHLVAPSSSKVFAVRHVLESLFLEKFLPKNARFADIGTGAGFPSIPCLIVREDLRAVLIESKLKKADFLEKVLAELDLKNRAEIVNRQFEETAKPEGVRFVTSRALDKFTQKLPRILRWSKPSELLLFGGDSLGEELTKNRVKFQQKLIPQSEQRFLFLARN